MKKLPRALQWAFLFLPMGLAVGWIRADSPEPFPLVYPESFGRRFTIPDDNLTTKQGVELGRMLFYETRLSKNNTISCGSCHQQSKAFTDGLATSVGVSGKGTQRNSMSLVNLLWVRQLFWDGRSSSLESQALVPLAHPDEMGQTPDAAAHQLQQIKRYPPLFRQAFGSDTITGVRIAKAIAQFERTLISADSPFDRSLRNQYVLNESEQRGQKLFMTGTTSNPLTRGGNCTHCHGGARLYQEVFHNNGLDSLGTDSGRQTVTGNIGDRGRFRAPTLRNIALTAPYMHDGRFASLDQVLDHYSDHVKASPTLSHELNGPTLALTVQEKTDLIAFIQLFTDSSFVNNPNFSDPFRPVSAALPTRSRPSGSH